MSLSSPNRLNPLSQKLDDEVPSTAENIKAAAPEVDGMTPAEEAVLRAEKLRTIREAIDRGTYDSE